MKRATDNYDKQVDIGRRIFLEYDQETLIRKFSLEADRQYIYLTYLNTPRQPGERADRRAAGGCVDRVPGFQRGYDDL